MRLQVHVHAADDESPPTSNFLEIANPNATLEDLANSIGKRYGRLYPHRP